MRCREAADTSAHDNEIVNFLRIGRCRSGLPKRAIAKTMRGFERTGMAPAKACERWRVIICLAGRFNAWSVLAKRGSSKERTANDHGRPIEEIPAGNRPIYPQIAVVVFTHEFLPIGMDSWSPLATNHCVRINILHAKVLLVNLHFSCKLALPASPGPFATMTS